MGHYRAFHARSFARWAAAKIKSAQPVADVVSSGGLPATLITDLTARRTAALQVTAAANVPVMVAAVAHALALQAFYRFAHDTCVKLSVDFASPDRNMDVTEACAAVQPMAD